MKSIKSYILGLAAMSALTVGFSACQDDIDAPVVEVPQTDLVANTTILELKERFWDEATNYATTIEDANNPERRFIIEGTVISSDEEGNIFKSLVIQDKTAALAFSIDSYNLYLNYRPGQKVVMDVTGQEIGKYAGLQQMGRKSWYSNGSTWQVSFMSLARFETFTELSGLPEVADIDTMTVNTFSEITQAAQSADGIRKWQSRLVRFRNVYFEEGGKRKFSVWHTKENDEQNTNLVDRQGGTMIVRTSGYCTFFNQTLPVGNIDLVGILSYYNGTWQIMMLDGEGVLPAGEIKGTEENPYSVTEAIQEINSGIASKSWVKGYIVGTLQPEVTEVTSNSDIDWDAPFILSNNIIIAPSATTADYTQCMVVRLPSQSTFQQYGNLVNNPSNLGKEIKVLGDLATDFGMAGVTNNGGTDKDFAIEGVTPEPTPVEPGSGVTVMATDMTVPGTTTAGSYSITVNQGSGATAPAQHASTSAVRLYNGNTISFAGAGLTSIKFVLAKDAGFRYTTVQCSTGSISPAQAEGDTEFTWVGDASEVTFTVDADATLGSDGPEKRGQIRFTQIDINGGGNGGGDTPNPPTPPIGSGDGASILATALTVPGSTTIDGYVITADKGSGATAPAQHAATEAVRLYNGNTLTVAGTGLKSIKFVLAKDAGFRYTTVQCSTGSISPAQAEGDTEFTWVGDASEVTFTVDADATLGSDGPEKRGQIRFTQIDINGGGNGGNTPDTPDTPDVPGADVTIEAKSLTVPGSTTISGYTIVADKANGATAPAQHAATEAVRLYNGNTLSISGGTMTAITFTLAKDAGFRYTTVQCSTGSISPAQAEGDTSFTWVGNASEVTFTVDADATLGSDGPEKRGQIRFTQIGITAAR